MVLCCMGCDRARYRRSGENTHPAVAAGRVLNPRRNAEKQRVHWANINLFI